MSGNRIISFVLALAVVLCAASLAEACPECKKQFTDNMARGYFWSILFMLSMPILIITGLGSYFYWEVRRAYAREALEQTLAAPELDLPATR
jgi:heme/copper-type cytochrome/quinol oxidase subunit 2